MDTKAEAYRAWILAQAYEGCTIGEGKGDGLTIESEGVNGWVGFYDIDDTTIVELRLERKQDGEALFFLHFELEDLIRAQDLFKEMMDALADAEKHEIRQILLCCSCGMTTTFFANKLNELVRGLRLDYEFSAQPIEKAKQEGASYAAVLLAPQVGHQRATVVEALPRTPVIEIPGKLFGSYDASGVLRLVVDTLAGTRQASGEVTVQIKRDYDRTKRVLALSFIHREDEPTLGYRVLDHGEIAFSGVQIGRSMSIQSLEDLAATLRVRGWKMSDFDAIGIAVPRIVDDGKVVEVKDGHEVLYDAAGKLSELWGAPVSFDYNACAAAVGCYAMQDKYENVAFHAQAIGVPDGEEGYVVEGKPLMGFHGRSGHLGSLAAGFALDMDLADAAWRVGGMRQLVGRYLASIACTIAPEVIYVWCDLLPDMDELREELERTLPPAAVPELVGVSDYDECVLTGELALCLHRLRTA